MTKVLHVIPGISGRYGGTTTTIRALCAALAKQPGIEIELATTDADGPDSRIAASEVPTDFATHVFPRTATEQWKYSRQLGQWLSANTRHFDIVHIHGLWSYASGAAARAARRAGVPYIIRPAGMLSPYTFANPAWKKALYWRLMERATVMGAAAFHATSHGERDDIQCVRSSVPVFVIPNGVDDAAWTIPCDQAPANRRNGDRPTVLFLSRLHPKKGIVDILLPAWQRVAAGGKLLIAGGKDPHYPQYTDQIRQTIARLKLHSRVRLLGPASSAQRWQLYDSADIFVLPSHSENFGIVVAEAMARGCPVLVADKVQSAEHVTQSGAGRVVDCSVDKIAQAMQELLSDENARRDHGERGRAYAREHFRWGAAAEQVSRMYSSIVNSNGS